jgi:hypothetical protein
MDIDSINQADAIFPESILNGFSDLYQDPFISVLFFSP